MNAARMKDTLEELWREVAPVRPHTRSTSDSLPSTLYSNPANWRRTRGIALIHQESQSVLGHFSEYVHLTVAGCRKLVRENAAASVSAAEYVSGDWWLGQSMRPARPDSWHEQRPAILGIQLPLMQLHAPAVSVVVCLSFGSIARVELAGDTTFSAAEGPETLLMLPKGTDVLQVMALENKITLRKALGL